MTLSCAKLVRSATLWCVSSAALVLTPALRLPIIGFTVDPVRARALGKLLRQWRKARGLNRVEAHGELEEMGIPVSYSQLSKLETGARSLASAALDLREGLRNLYRVDVDTWERETGLHVPVSVVADTRPARTQGNVQLETPNLRSSTRPIPVYDLISAGPGGDGGTVIETADIPDTWKGEHAGYVVSGDSMAPAIPDQARVIVKLQDYATPGNLIVCFAPDHGMLVKKLQRIEQDGTFVLTSFNPAHPAIWAQDVTIVGVVREVRTKFEVINGNHGK